MSGYPKNHSQLLIVLEEIFLKGIDLDTLGSPDDREGAIEEIRLIFDQSKQYEEFVKLCTEKLDIIIKKLGEV